MERPWFKHYDEPVPHSLEYPSSTIYQLLERTTEKYPNNTALVFFGNTITYEALSEDVGRLAQGLHELGIGKGDHVLLMLPNCPQMVMAYYSLFRLGAVAVPANPLYQERELEHQISNSGAETVICLDVFYPKIASVRSRLKIPRVIVTRIQEYLPAIKKLAYSFKQRASGEVSIGEDAGVMSFKDLIRPPQDRARLPEASPEDVAILQYTGGTTGVSKGAMITHANIIANTYQMRAWYFIIREGKEVLLGILPLFHTYGIAVCMNLSISAGSALVLLPRFSPLDIFKSIQEHRATFFPGIPGIYAALGHHRGVKKWDLSSVTYCVSGSAPLPVKTLEDFEGLTGSVILEGYGLTEASPVTHSNPLHTGRKVGSIGMPLPDTDCKIVDLETGEKEVPPGETGELCIRGPQVMKGYWNNSRETDLTLRAGWLYTGDVARMDEEGYFYIVDRKKDMIISEGYNVYPNEIDEMLAEHPKVLEAAVVGVPDKLKGEKIVAFVVLKDGEAASQEDIVTYCREHLARYKVPKRVEIREELPKSPVGKVLKRILREEAGQRYST
jgi:long-chain acyl-CoA synthetase